MSGYRWFIRFWLIDCDRVGRDPHSILPGGEWHDGAGGGRIPQLTLGRLLTHLTTETGLRAGFPLNSWENPERLAAIRSNSRIYRRSNSFIQEALVQFTSQSLISLPL